MGISGVFSLLLSWFCKHSDFSFWILSFFSKVVITFLLESIILFRSFLESLIFTSNLSFRSDKSNIVYLAALSLLLYFVFYWTYLVSGISSLGISIAFCGFCGAGLSIL